MISFGVASTLGVPDSARWKFPPRGGEGRIEVKKKGGVGGEGARNRGENTGGKGEQHALWSQTRQRLKAVAYRSGCALSMSQAMTKALGPWDSLTLVLAEFVRLRPLVAGLQRVVRLLRQVVGGRGNVHSGRRGLPRLVVAAPGVQEGRRGG